MTFLELCRRFVVEVGINGQVGPSAVTGQSGELANVVAWIAEADLYVANLWQDWKFLWREHQPILTIGSTAVAGPSGYVMRRFDRQAFYLNKDQQDWTQLRDRPWREFRGRYDVGVIATRRPEIITSKPDGSMLLNTKSDDTHQLFAEGWARPQLMTANADEPNVPEEFYRVIIARAMISYGVREDAPEILAGGEAEYADVLEKLESSELEDQEGRRTAADDSDAHVEVDYRG